MIRILTILPPASVVEVMESVPSVCLSVCLSVQVCESYIVHHLVGTKPRCAPSTCIVHHRATLCTMMHKWVCERYVVHHLVGTGLHHGAQGVAPNIMAKGLWGQGTVQFRSQVFSFPITIRRNKFTRLLPQYACCYMSGEAANQSSLPSNNYCFIREVLT